MKPFSEEINSQIVRRWVTNPPQVLLTLVHGKEVVYAEYAQALADERDRWANLAAKRALELAEVRADLDQAADSASLSAIAAHKARSDTASVVATNAELRAEIDTLKNGSVALFKEKFMSELRRDNAKLRDEINRMHAAFVGGKDWVPPS